MILVAFDDKFNLEPDYVRLFILSHLLIGQKVRKPENQLLFIYNVTNKIFAEL